MNMSKIRKQYDREFKVMALELSKGRSDLGVLAKELGIRPSLLYRWRKELEAKAGTSFPGQGKVLYTPEQAEIHRLTNQILKVYQNSKSTYGSLRIARELNRKGIKVSRPRVARLMQKAKIRSIIKRKFKVTTDSSHKFSIMENRLERNFKPGIIGVAWVSDITYIKTGLAVPDNRDRHRGPKSNRLGIECYHEGDRNSDSGL